VDDGCADAVPRNVSTMEPIADGTRVADMMMVRNKVK
jgi:hypothetical protein